MGCLEESHYLIWPITVRSARAIAADLDAKLATSNWTLPLAGDRSLPHRPIPESQSWASWLIDHKLAVLAWTLDGMCASRHLETTLDAWPHNRFLAHLQFDRSPSPAHPLGTEFAVLPFGADEPYLQVGIRAKFRARADQRDCKVRPTWTSLVCNPMSVRR